MKFKLIDFLCNNGDITQAIPGNSETTHLSLFYAMKGTCKISVTRFKGLLAAAKLANVSVNELVKTFLVGGSRVNVSEAVTCES